MTEKSKAVKSANETALPEVNVQELVKQNEELLKRLEMLEKAQTSKPRTFEEQLRHFEYQQQVITHLQKFQSKKEILTQAAAEVREKTESGDFDAKVYNLCLISTNGQQKKVFEISNPVIIAKVLDSVTVEIDLKIEALKGEVSM